MEILPRNIEYNRSSIIDEIGRIFSINNKIYRGIKYDYIERIKKLIEIYPQLPNLIEARISEYTSSIYPIILEHRKLDFITYKEEWCAEMYRTAAISYLELQDKLSKIGFNLKDGHTLNIFFDYKRPIFIDWGSLCPNSGWQKEQFYNCFVKPLCKLSKTNICFQELEDIQNLIIKIGSLIFPDIDGEWLNYVQVTNEESLKYTEVSNWLSRTLCESVLDVGASYGIFSKMALDFGKRVVAMELEPTVCNRLYNSLSDGDKILVVNCDINSPDDILNNNNLLYSRVDRLKCDAVMALSVVHHFCKKGLTFNEIVANISSYAKKELIIEFIPKDDIFVRNWEMPNWYTLDNFMLELSKIWDDLQIKKSAPDPRVLIIGSKKNDCYL